LLSRAWAQQTQPPLAAAKDALNVMEFEEMAHRALPPAHWGYMTTGVDDDATLRANREGFTHYQIRPRRLVDVRKTDLTTDLFGSSWETPIVIAPVGGHKMFHPEGEIAVARAAKAKRHLQILSTVTTSSVEDVIQARGGPIWYQLYPTSSWDVRQKLVKRAEAAGCPVLVLTVDLSGGRNLETALRLTRSRNMSNMVALCAGTDGIDGNSPAAGAIVDSTTIERATAIGLDVEDFLRRSDSYSFFVALGDVIATGPTGTNVRDLRILLAAD